MKIGELVRVKLSEILATLGPDELSKLMDRDFCKATFGMVYRLREARRNRE